MEPRFRRDNNDGLLIAQTITITIRKNVVSSDNGDEDGVSDDNNKDTAGSQL